jgi:hypothetical protein
MLSERVAALARMAGTKAPIGNKRPLTILSPAKIQQHKTKTKGV